MNDREDHTILFGALIWISQLLNQPQNQSQIFFERQDILISLSLFRYRENQYIYS